MAEGRRRHLVGTIREGRADDRAEVAVVDREPLGEGVVEWQVALVVEAHRIVVGRALATVGLLCGVVHQDEAVIGTGCQRSCGIVEVGFAVAALPVVLEVRPGAVVGIVEGENGAPIVVNIRVGAGVIAGGIPLAPEPIDAGVISGRACSAATVIRRAAGVGEHAKVVVEGMILLHHDDDVVDFAQISVGPRRRSPQAGNGE